MVVHWHWKKIHFITTPDPTCPRFLRFPEATKRRRATLDWRKENGIDGILSEDQPYFQSIKRFYRHFFHGRSKAGSSVYYHQLGKSDFGRLWSSDGGITPADVLRHQIFILEYAFSAAPPVDALVTVWDLEGLRMNEVIGEMLETLRALINVTFIPR